MATEFQEVTTTPTVLAGVTPGNAVGVQPQGGIMFTANSATQPAVNARAKFRLAHDQYYRAEPLAGEQTWVWCEERRVSFDVVYEAV